MKIVPSDVKNEDLEETPSSRQACTMGCVRYIVRSNNPCCMLLSQSKNSPLSQFTDAALDN